MIDTSARFVWMHGLRGPEPQIWREGGQPATTGMRVLASRPISVAESTLPVTVLATKYPAPAPVEPGVATAPDPSQDSGATAGRKP